MNKKFLAKTFMWMGFGLALTAFISYAVIVAVEMNPKYYLYLNRMWWIVLFFQMFLGLAIAAAFNKMSTGMLALLYLIYTAVNGLWIGPLLIMYDVQAVISALVVTVILFIVMSGLALFTNINFLKAGGIIVFGLFGIIISSCLNVFVFLVAPDFATTIYWGITYFAVFLFTLMIAYNIKSLQKLSTDEMITDQNSGKFAIIGAFNLYLTIINLFLYLLRIFGRRR